MVRYILIPVLALCAAACTPQTPAASGAAPVQFDTGNMAYPAPLPVGNINAVRTR